MFQKIKKFLLMALPAIIIAIFMIGIVVYAWVEPNLTPPGNNVSAPINVSIDGQIKTGGLSLGSLIVNGGSNFKNNITADKQLSVAQTTYLATQGSEGVGIGYEVTPSAKLDIRVHSNIPKSGIRVSTTTNGIDINTHFIVDKDGRVGIGIADPENRKFPTVPDSRVLLDVNGAAKIKHIGLLDHNSIVRWVDPDEDKDYFSIWSSQNPTRTAVFRMNSTDTASGGDYAFSFSWADTERLKIKKDGNVYINGNTVTNGSVAIDRAVGISPVYWYRNGGITKFSTYVEGDKWHLGRYDDAGAWVGTPLSILRSNGNVGIGMTDPLAKLHVRGDTNGVAINVTNVLAANYSLNVSSGGTSRLLVRADGNVGIGTTNPTEKLVVVGNTTIDGGNLNVIGNVIVRDNVIISGKLTATGGVDPPYISFSEESYESIRQYAKEVSEHEKVMQFWNGKAKRIEIYVINEDRFYTIMGELIVE